MKSFIENLAGLDGGYHQYTVESTSQTSDLRFTYCAVVICSLLNLSILPVQNVVDYIQSTYTFEGSYGSICAGEAHGGYTYCAIASLKLLTSLPTGLQLHRIIDWCLRRQGLGFAGRVNKSEDTCYSFWIGASLKILNCDSYIDYNKNTKFLLLLQSKLGGFGKDDASQPDILHTYFSLAAFSMMGNYSNSIAPVVPELNLSSHAYQRYLDNKDKEIKNKLGDVM